MAAKKQIRDTHATYLKDLRNSGITPAFADANRVVYLEPDEAEILTGFHVPVTVFVYPDINGNDTEFLRAKLLAPPPSAAWPTKDEPPRYWQPPHSPSRFYLPKCLPWATIAKDPLQPIYITEGEKKALCAAKHGLNCLAIGGVGNWKSAKRLNQPIISDMDLIEWKGRTIYLCFDADMVTNPQVTKQLSDLSRELSGRGARHIKIVELPTDTHVGSKCGLDDFIHSFGIDEYTKLIESAQEMKYEALLWTLNERFAYVSSMRCVYDFSTSSWATRNQFFDETAPLKVTQIKLSGTGNNTSVQNVEVDANKTWWEWRSRRSYMKHDYLPGVTAHSDTTMNTWPGWGTVMKVGDTEPFIKLLDHVLHSLTPDQRAWFMKWMAYPLQFPLQGKMFTAVMCHARIQGSGKSYIGEILSDIYGTNATTLTNPDQLTSPHNTWLDNKQFIVADEILLGSRRETDRVKNFVTSDKHRINPKGVADYERRALMNFYLTSNHSDALKLTDEDRRWFIIHAQEKRLSPAFIKELRAWRKAGGASHLHEYLTNEVYTEDFKPWAAAPLTDARDDMISAAISEVEAWCCQLRDDPDSILSVDSIPIKCDLFTEIDWRSASIIPDHIRTHSTTIRNVLSDMGFQQVRRLKSQKHWPGAEKNLWCLRNRKFWQSQSKEDWSNHYAKWLRGTKQYHGTSKFA